MRRLIIIVGLIIFILWLAKPTITQKIVGNDWSNSLVPQTNLLTNQLKQQAKQIGYYVEDKTQEILGDSITLNIVTKPPRVEITKKVPKKQSRNIILIDYLTSKAIALNFTPNAAYYLDIRNLPEGMCFYINRQFYTIPKGEYLKVVFLETTKYKMYFDHCNREAKKFGEIIVE